MNPDEAAATATAVALRFSDLLASLQGNRATSLTMNPSADPDLCAMAQQHVDRLIEALVSNQSLFSVKLSIQFLAHLTPQHHRQTRQIEMLRALWGIQTLGVLQIVANGDNEDELLSMQVIAESLPQFPLKKQSINNVTKSHHKANGKDLCRLILQNIRITSMAEVQAVANGLRRLNRVLAVTEVCLGPLFIDTKRQHLLDPLIQLLVDMRTAHRQVIHATTMASSSLSPPPPLVSCEAAQQFMTAFEGTDTIFQRGFPSVLELSGLALNDDTVGAMTKTLQTFPLHHLGEMYLYNNPGLTAASLEGCLRAIDHCENLSVIQFGKEEWDATVKLHVKLNGLGRRQAVDRGLYTNRNVWFDWVMQLATVKRLVQTFHFERYCRDNDALALSAIFLAVRGQPNYVVDG